MDSRRREEALLFLAGLALFLFAVPAREFIGFEPRFALFVQEMLRHGWTLFPHTHLGPYPDYPGSSTWLLTLLARLSGGFTLPLAVVPSALASAWTLLMTWRIAALADRRWAWGAVLALLGTQEFLQQARTLSLDPYVMAFLATGMWWLLSAHQQRRPVPFGRLLLLQLLALAFRGPIGLVMVAGVEFVCLGALQGWRAALGLGTRAFAALLAGTAALLGAAWLEGGSAFVDQVVRMEVVGRFGVRDPLSVYWFNSFGNYFYGYLLAAPVAVVGLWQRRWIPDPFRPLLLAALLWMLVILVGMSVPATKKARYLLPMAPALALVASAPLLAVPGAAWRRLQRGISGLLRLLPLVGMAAVGALALRPPERLPELELNLGVLGGALAFLSWRAVRPGGGEGLRPYLLATLAVYAINLLLLEPFEWRRQRSAPFVQRVEEARRAAHAGLGFYRLGADGAAVVYLANADTGDRPRFFRTWPEGAALRQPLMLVASPKEAPPGAGPVAVRGVLDGEPMEAVLLRPAAHE